MPSLAASPAGAASIEGAQMESDVIQEDVYGINTAVGQKEIEAQHVKQEVLL